MSGSLFDFGLYFFHNAKTLMAKGTGPYFYLPKMEHYLEARLWNDVFVFAQDYCGVPQGTIRATVLIETILGGVPDGRDSLGAARSFGGPELRALGLHFQLHQEVRQRGRISCCRTARWSRWTGTS